MKLAAAFQDRIHQSLAEFQPPRRLVDEHPFDLTGAVARLDQCAAAQNRVSIARDEEGNAGTLECRDVHHMIALGGIKRGRIGVGEFKKLQHARLARRFDRYRDGHFCLWELWYEQGLADAACVRNLPWSGQDCPI
ncbi:Hypothetical protein NGAL_HAMBI1146_04550 [Neorhizobium galegae bv. officinalis]|nr:Hypothetical protein NGAL_HAMBI1146_04550 [Neorhizobium galegae bv. officinalis]